MSTRMPGSEGNALLDHGAALLGDAPTSTARSAPPKRTEDQMYASRAEQLLSALDVVEDTGNLLLPELTQKSGQPIVLHVKRMSVQELLSADLVPQRALKMTAFMIDQAEARVKRVRQRWNLPEHTDPTPEQMEADQLSIDQVMRDAQNYLGGGTTGRAEAMAGIYAFLGAVVCACTMSPRLYFDQDQLDTARAAGKDGALVWRIPENDLWHVFNWALKTEARAVRQNVEPFPQPTNNAAAAPSQSRVRPDAGRADDV